jgi:hypothetical protein
MSPLMDLIYESILGLKVAAMDKPFVEYNIINLIHYFQFNFMAGLGDPAILFIQLQHMRRIWRLSELVILLSPILTAYVLLSAMYMNC